VLCSKVSGSDVPAIVPYAWQLLNIFRPECPGALVVGLGECPLACRPPADDEELTRGTALRTGRRPGR
jgi:hypothetical protein